MVSTIIRTSTLMFDYQTDIRTDGVISLGKMTFINWNDKKFQTEINGISNYRFIERTMEAKRDETVIKYETGMKDGVEYILDIVK